MLITRQNKRLCQVITKSVEVIEFEHNENTCSTHRRFRLSATLSTCRIDDAFYYVKSTSGAYRAREAHARRQLPRKVLGWLRKLVFVFSACFHEACLQPEAWPTCATRHNCSIHTDHYGSTSGGSSWRDFRWNMQNTVASTTGTPLLWPDSH